MTATRIANLIKQYSWGLNLLFVALGAYFTAGAANSVVARNLWTVPDAQAAAPAGAMGSPSGGPRAQPKIELTALAARNLFGAQRENLNPVAEEVETEDTGPGELDPNDLKPCSLSASLRATLVADGAPEWSLAVIHDSGSRETGVYSINEGTNTIGGDATLVEIRSREIVVRRRDHFELCQAEGEGGKPAPPSRPRAGRERPTPEPETSDDGAVTKVAANSWDVSKDYLDNDIMSNLSKVATQARIVPSFKNGKPNGFKLFSIKPGSIYSKIGLQNGDVIGKINGYEMNSPDKALEIYQKLKDATSVTVELQRRGQPMTFNYAIR